ncbi:hypothetical protein CY34DRAFT_19803 [Suillus luteus UH-Slu-Lm8-n1]|uniref:Uncharacterized protein n=1 Tax=Suillus luteus UH-Slu-Lm8-n1 TaxID=930992 RepID=A0A0D0A077_9AGAM|nr:hypothetical protein CY34DRAFT_19803 [Suillus luteus UH-Slu-Lm8-n1]
MTRPLLHHFAYHDALWHRSLQQLWTESERPHGTPATRISFTVYHFAGCHNKHSPRWNVHNARTGLTRFPQPAPSISISRSGIFDRETTPFPGAIETKPGSATVSFFGIEPAILDPVSGKKETTSKSLERQILNDEAPPARKFVSSRGGGIDRRRLASLKRRKAVVPDDDPDYNPPAQPVETLLVPRQIVLSRLS